MSGGPDDLTAAFTGLLKGYVADGGEGWLAAAADLGRRAVHADTPVEEIAEVFEVALASLVDEVPDTPFRDVAGRVVPPLAEVLMGFGLAWRRERDRQEAERRLRQQERLMAAVYRSVPLAMALLDPAGRIVSVNRGWLDLFGGREEEAVGRPFVLPADAAAGGDWRVADAVGEPRVLQARTAALDTDADPVDAAAPPLTLIALYDFTRERRQAEAARQHAMMESLGKVASGMAHEINNLLQPVIALTEMALDLVPAEGELRELLAPVLDSGYQARGIVRNFLAFAHRESAVNRPLDLTAALEHAAGFVRCVVPPTLRLVVEGIADGGPLTVKANEAQLSQIIVNLVGNAADAMDRRGEVHLTLDRIVLTDADAAALGIAGGAVARLTVRDQGCGMDEATRTRAFEPFFTTKPVGHGSGLGLSVVVGIVRGWQGAVTLASHPGEGTSVTLVLPLVGEAG